MRLPVVFYREKGGTNPPATLGSDAAPTNAPPSSTNDNVLSCKIRDIVGCIVQRVAVAWWTSAATPVALNGSLYAWDEGMNRWFLLNATPLSMPPNQVVYFDVPAIAEPPSNAKSVLGTGQNGASATSNTIDVMLIVTDPGAAVNGTYNIGMGPDLSSIGS